MRIHANVPAPLPESSPAAATPQNPRPFAEVMGKPAAAPPTAPPGNETVVPPVEAPSPGAEALKGLLDKATAAEKRMDHRLAEVAAGKVYSPQELIALQVEAFRYSQSVEVVSRVTDKVVSGVKQILSIQV